MLRLILLFLSCCWSALPAFSQSASKAGGHNTPTILHTRANSRHKVYIECDRTADARKALFNFTLDSFDSEMLQSNFVAALSDTPERDSHCLPAAQNLHGLATEWLPLYQYKKKFYLYEPCDKGTRNRIVLQPTMLLHYYMDGPSIDLLQSVTKEAARQYKLVTYVCGPEGRDPSLVRLHMLDRTGQLAVWEWVGAPEGQRYELRVTPAGAAAFDLIVYSCPDHKEPEWDGFEAIDFEKLLPVKR